MKKEGFAKWGFLVFCDSNISIGDVNKGGYVEAGLFTFQQALWGMSLSGFIFREVVGFKSAPSLEGDSATDISWGFC